MGNSEKESLTKPLDYEIFDALFYLIEEKRIVILACLHQKRNEIDWLRRAK